MEINQYLIKEAINSHSQFSPNQREVLNILIDLAINGEVVADIHDIQKLVSSTRATISTAIAFLNKYGVIENTNVKGKKFTGCRINSKKLEEIVTYYLKKKNISKS